jgi:hypothetical protein
MTFRSHVVLARNYESVVNPIDLMNYALMLSDIEILVGALWMHQQLLVSYHCSYIGTRVQLSAYVEIRHTAPAKLFRDRPDEAA